MNEAEYAYLKRKVRRLLNIDVDAYKSQQMRRRLEAFVLRHGAGDLSQFHRRLDTDSDMLTALRDMLTINVSEFFRDFRQFEYLQSTVLPELLQRNVKIKIWSAGCSHGDEPYTVAIILAEMSCGSRGRILATDLDRETIRRAKAGGPYRPDNVRNVPQWLLQKYFTRSDEGYRVIKEIRSRVRFREHNLLSDEYENGFDLLICRNVMIYFSAQVKSDLFRKFHGCLKPGGMLFIGGTEALLGADGAGFERLSGNFFRKISVVPARTRGEPAASSARG